MRLCTFLLCLPFREDEEEDEEDDTRYTLTAILSNPF